MSGQDATIANLFQIEAITKGTYSTPEPQTAENSEIQPVKLDPAKRHNASDRSASRQPNPSSLLEDVQAVVYRAIIHADGSQNLQFISENLVELTGLTAEEAIAQPGLLDALVHPGDRKMLKQATLAAMKRLQPLQRRYRLVTVSGAVVWVEERAYFTQGFDGRILVNGLYLTLNPNVAPIEDVPQARFMPTARQLQHHSLYQLIERITLLLHQSPYIEDILRIAVEELQTLFNTDRVVIAQRFPQGNSINIAEALKPECQSVLHFSTHNSWLEEDIEFYLQGGLKVIDSKQDAGLSINTVQDLYQQQIQSVLVVPLSLQGSLWGFLALHHCQQSHTWHHAEIDLLKHLALQIGLAIQSAELYQQMNRINMDLERKFQSRTAQLQLAFEFEATLKRITDKVRDSLDEDQILQIAVQELTIAIGISGCNAALYDLSKGTSTICYEYTTSVSPYYGRVAHMKAVPEIYDQLFRGYTFQFCSIVPNPERGHVSMLTCPIMDDQRVLGDLWLINHKFYAFSEQDIRLVQLVANQCAIALRQARLYKAAQAQVAELERLNRLKDDFLSTVSHELRTPIASIKMAAQMLELTLKRAELVEQTEASVSRYLQILQSECNREISLVNDLLDLSRLEADADTLVLGTRDVQPWVSMVVQPFVERTTKQQQHLEVDYPPVSIKLTSDFSKLERILSELLHNACKYTPPQERICLQINTHASQLELRVSNSGVEIAPQEMTRIFEKFYRIPNTEDPWKHGGTGLGLALVKKLIEQLQGTIEVSSNSRETTFLVKIPLSFSVAQS